MTKILPVYVSASALVIFSGNNLKLKTLGFFLQGLFHIKASLSYMSIVDLIPENRKTLTFTLMTAFNAGTAMFACLIFKFYKPSE